MSRSTEADNDTMIQFIARRTVAAVPILLLVTIMVFLTTHVLPGDAAIVALGPEATPQALEAMRERMGLNRPLHIQYLDWVGGVVRGDLGRSLVDNTPVTRAIGHALPVTLQMVAMAMFVAIIIGVPAGIVSATKRGTLWDGLASFVGLAGISIPGFWAAILLIYAFSLNLPWFPSSGFVRLSEGLGPNLRHAVLPVLALGIRPAGIFMRQVRSSILEVIRSDYIRTARAKGLGENTVTLRHALRNALIPVVTVSGAELASMLGNLVVVDTIFGVPGFGRLIYSSILRQDVTMMQSTVLIFGVMVIFVNLLVDLSYTLLDPRIKYD